MTDPRRLVDEGADDFEVRLLRAARRDALSFRGRRRIWASLGFGSIVSATLAASTAEAGVRGWMSSVGAARWVAGGSVSAIAVWAGVQALSPAAPPNASPASPHVHVVAKAQRETPAVNEAASPSSTEPAATPEPVEKAPPAKAATARAERASDSLPAELAALDQARAALSRRDASGAIRLLDEYVRHFPKRRLETEATVLRIEALVARGDRVAASRLGREFLARQPNGPYARRVSSLVLDPSRAAKAEP